jgi:dipeptidyl aminopeptidase/acylaminoacyl peptidase
MRFLIAVAIIFQLVVLIGPCAAEITVGEPVQFPTPEGKFTMPSFSPDSRYLAFAKAGYGGLYTSDWQGHFSTVAESPLSGWRYSWAPDGRNLAYRVRYEDTSAVAGMVSSPDGQTQAQVTDWQNDLFPPQWGKDGIAFKAGDDMMTVDETGNVKAVKSLSEGRGIVSRVAALSAALFANGVAGVTTTAFAALVPASSGKSVGKGLFTNGDNELWTIDENGDVKKLLDVSGESGYFSPQTSPTGDAVAAPGLSGNLYVADTSTGQYANFGVGQNPTWSPDGRYLIYEVATEDGHDITGSELWIASRDGKFKRQLSLNSGIKRYPSWSPDGRTLAFEVDGKIYYAPIQQ